MPAIPEITQEHLRRIAAFYDQAPTGHNWSARSYRRLLAHYYNQLIPPGASVLEVGCGSGELLAQVHAARKVGIDLSTRQIEAARQRIPDGRFFVQAGETLELAETFDYIIISETLNLAADAQRLLQQLHKVTHPESRLIINFFSSLWRPPLAVARWFGLRAHLPQSSWMSPNDVSNLLQLADWSPLTSQSRLLLPVACLGLDRLLNRWLAPIFTFFCLTNFCVARSVRRSPPSALTVSVIIPARNEAGNIEAAVLRTPELGAGTELIFVEGHSKDDTWQQIQRVARDCKIRLAGARIGADDHAGLYGQLRHSPDWRQICDWRRSTSRDYCSTLLRSAPWLAGRPDAEAYPHSDRTWLYNRAGACTKPDRS